MILLVGGITLYRTFALYEEKKEFNVLRGRVPNFGEYDISILAITVDGEKASTIPEANNYVVNVDCQNGSGYWDYDHWNAVITEINSQTKCNLHFETSTESNIWRTWIQKGEVTKYYTTLHHFLSDTEAVTQVFNNNEASTYLKENPSIVGSMKEDSNYLPNSLPEVGENLDSRSELVKIILDSTGLTNQEKYNLQLPFYVFKDGNSFLTFKNLTSRGYNNGIAPVYGATYGTSIYLSIKSLASDCAFNVYRSNQTINCDAYKMMSIRYTGSTTISTYHSWALGYTSKTSTTDISVESGLSTHTLNNSGWYSKNITSITGNKYAGVETSACSSNGMGTAAINVYEWYMY